MNSNDIDQHDFDQERRLQAEAERAERERSAPGRDLRVDRYRLVVRALKQPLVPQLPADFDVRVAALAGQREQGEGFEDWIIVLLLLAMGIGALLFVGPVLANAAHAMVGLSLPPLPWRQVVMAAACIALVWGIDRGLTMHGWVRTHPGSRKV